jgi:hypothetical protein
MSSGVSRTAVGGYVGTGVAQQIKAEKVDFQPRKVEIHRMTTAFDKVEWMEGMDVGCGIKTPGAGGARTSLSPNGVTPLTSGFEVGTDASVNNVGDTYIYVAHE